MCLYRVASLNCNPIETLHRKDTMKTLFANFLITMDLISCRLGKSLITVLLLTLGFILSGMTLLCVNITDYDHIQYQKNVTLPEPAAWQTRMGTVSKS